MINSIIQSIGISINAEFDCAIYTEEQNQDLTKPYFLIACAHLTAELAFGKKYRRENQFCIKYVPFTTEKQAECNEAAEKLFWCLEYINMDGSLMHGTKMKYEIVDGILQFYINYDTFVYKVNEITPMVDLTPWIQLTENE